MYPQKDLNRNNAFLWGMVMVIFSTGKQTAVILINHLKKKIWVNILNGLFLTI